MDVPTWVWIATGVVTLAIFTFDLAVVGRRPARAEHEGVRDLPRRSTSGWPSCSASACGSPRDGTSTALEFFSGWLVEYSLSIDNLFIFIIIMAKFAVPA